MKEIRTEICYWYEVARQNYHSRETRKVDTYAKCYNCNGHGRDCDKYYPVIKVWPKRENEWPYEIVEKK